MSVRLVDSFRWHKADCLKLPSLYCSLIVHTKARTALASLFFLSKGGNGIFNVRNYLNACFRTKARQSLTILHKWSLLSESRRGIFNARNDFNACCAPKARQALKFCTSTFSYRKVDLGSLTRVMILARAVHAKATQALTRLHKCPLLSKGRRGIFNARKDLSACRAHEGETGTDETAHIPSRINN